MGLFDAIKKTFTGTEPETPEENKYDEGLEKSRSSFGEKLNALFANFRTVDEDFFEDLEEMLIESDVGFETAVRLSDELREEVKLKNAKDPKAVSRVIVEKLVDMYGEAGKGEDNQLHFAEEGPTVFLFVGVNGAGKTTTVGKLAHQLKEEGKRVLLVAADTFRAGAIQQLQEWGRRVEVPVVATNPGGDPAAVVFDGVKRAKDEGYDVVLVDTAGRLQNKVNLMNELNKIKRVIVRELPDAPQEVLLVLDATTGQNALNQAKEFNQTTQITGIVLTKLDGSGKGGIVLAIRNELHVPVKLVGLGEKMDDLQAFDPTKFVAGLFKGLIQVDA
ncbi:signal recognition particle-docking protein FtsY [Lacticaseibacillus rhamnosus]|uniref:signal recognition particle-docking protein FtsY n=1 Tax=Lacticaseibacillus rhamnosus TaxID=47715 RepID=UPI0021A500A2|nr:signal recognition particle-docking protein FtsY [Lacticaseibacillus rhamnosus]MCT3169960.1 signal recognition particle-docking protein FtsY [Lacticaseibacillus rhamnosus]MCT3178207.1 signal recognition particle-docking protein FtsY [Lacticaseibacillus rhamnosus]MCT3183748.1 signal recognition particle-docking protein FtsY [Lacticaseibacillus rhamnosus]MCT4447925.1 signal recognition particle-docking protein FtsY [Lacticaseibacillus rhamnosus]